MPRCENEVMGKGVWATGCLLLLLAGCASAPALPPGPTDDEADAAVAEELAQYWRTIDQPGAPPAGVERVEFTTTVNWSTAQVVCLQAAGLAAREISGGYAIDDYGPLTPSEGVAAQWTCLRQFPVDPRSTGLLSDAQILYMYDYFAERLAPCLQLKGYKVAPVPVRDDYVHRVRTGEFWNPYYNVDGVPIATDFRVIDAACPALPDDPFGAMHPASGPGPG